jgi:MFS family permease
MGLYCNRQSDRDLIQAFLSVGSLIGLIVMNFVSDLRGRKLALIIDLLIAFSSSLRKIKLILVTIVGTYSQNMPLLIISSIMAGFSGYSLVVVSYIMAADVC